MLAKGGEAASPSLSLYSAVVGLNDLGDLVFVKPRNVLFQHVRKEPEEKFH